MPTSTKSRTYGAKALSDYYLYAPLGAGQLVVEKARELSKLTLGTAREKQADVMKAYEDLAERGRKVVSSLRTSPATRRAEEQIDAARVQLRTTVKSARRTGRPSTKAKKIS